MPVLLQIAIGGALGACLRHSVSGLISRRVGGEFPWGTLTVNVIGCFVMGLATMYLVRRLDADLQHLAPFVMTGILGGFTTFSAFSLEVVLLIERGRIASALGYAGGSVILGIAGFAAGLALLRTRYGG